MTLSTQVLLGLGLGILAGLFFGEEAAAVEVFGRGFVLLLQMTVLPYVVVSLIGGLGRLRPSSALSPIGLHQGRDAASASPWELTRCPLSDVGPPLEFLSTGRLIGTERCSKILLDGTGDPELSARVLAKAAGYRRREVLQHQRLRSEFHLRNLWAWYGPPGGER